VAFLEDQNVKTHLLQRAAAAALILACAGPAAALNIVLIDSNNSFASAPHGAEALFAFRKAANYWNQTLTNNVTVRIDIGFEALGPGILGSTGSFSNITAVSDIYQGLAATGNSALDASAVAHLVPLNSQGSLAMRVSNYLDPASHTGIDTTTTRLSNGNNTINQTLDVNTAVLKALHLDTGHSANAFDARITFSSNFGFDFNPSNGIGTGSYDFTAVAVHELGHALGFVSGTDGIDYFGHPDGPGASLFDDQDLDDYAVGSTLDLFRYGNGFNPDGSRQLQWSPDRSAFFSIDGGATVFNLASGAQQAAYFATGAYNGDGFQASHWAENRATLNADGCFQSTPQIGIMDPTLAACALGYVTQNDLAGFDAMGWNVNQDVLAANGYHATSQDVFALPGVAAIPEPASYAMLLAGLGVLGGVARRRTARRPAQ
jgi:hypothetical protein